MTVTVDLTNRGTQAGMRAIVISDTGGVPGKRQNDRIVVVSVELSHPWSRDAVVAAAVAHSYSGRMGGGGGRDCCRYQRVIATTSEGIRFVWDDATFGATDRGGHVQRYGSAGDSPWTWGDAEWKALFEDE
eukprot:jgi/Psemu1/282147/fgenesh1_pg.3_\